MAASTAYDVSCNLFNCKYPEIRTSSTPNQLYISDSISDEKCEALSMFSLYSNGKRLFSCGTTQSPNVIQCLHGIRSIATLWVIAGHTLVISFMLPTLQHAEFVDVINFSVAQCNAHATNQCHFTSLVHRKTSQCPHIPNDSY